MRPYHVFLALAALAPASLARADMLPSWTYSATPAASPIASDNNPFTGGVTLSPVASTAGSGSADVLLTNIRLFSSATADAPDRLSSNGAYSITLSLHDAASGADGSVTFAGKLGGTFSLSSANLTNVFTGPTSQTLTLGSDVYMVSLGNYVPPGAPPSTPPGAIYAHIDVASGSGGVSSTPTAPEPSALLLCCLGGAGCLVPRLKARWRRVASAA